MNRLAQIAILSFGWRRVLLLIVFGAIASLSMPSLFVLPALFVSLPIWVWCLDGAEQRKGLKRLFGPAFVIGFSFGLGYFLGALHWLGAAFFVDGGWLLVVMPFAIFALAAVLAIFWGFASVLAHYFWSDSFLRIFAFALSLSLFEFIRGYIFSGFPFDLLGYSLTANDNMAQITSVVGIYGLTGIAVFIGAMLALVWPKDGRSLIGRLMPVFIIISVILGQIAYGQYRLKTTKIIERSDIKLRLVQPNIKQSQKWQAGSSDFIMTRLLDLSVSKSSPLDAGINGITYLIWPEAAIPFYLSERPEYVSKISKILPMGKFLVTGAPRKESFSQNLSQSYNSILMFNSDGEIIASYDKTHLVPFGEYLPFENIFNRFGIKQFVTGVDGWNAGTSRRLMGVNGALNFLPLICYEVIFSGRLGDEIKGADFILNLTNDGWFDNSIGLEQSFHHARIRAIEEGRSLVRVANTGITALVDPVGVVRAKLDAQTIGVLDVAPPRPLKKTIFSQYRNYPFFLVLFLGFLMLILQKIRLKKKKYF